MCHEVCQYGMDKKKIIHLSNVYVYLNIVLCESAVLNLSDTNMNGSDKRFHVKHFEN